MSNHTETKGFTAGPWVFDEEKLDRHPDVIEDASGHLLMVLQRLPEVSPTQHTANARLIAAAPELYAALKALRLQCLADPLNPCWDNRPTDKPGLHWASEAGDPVKACTSCTARAALAKAEGKN